MRLLPFVMALCPAALAAQSVELDGPHPVGWRDVSFTDANFGRGFIQGRIYYPATSAGQNAPADPGAGPYTLVAHMHGWFGAPENYQTLSGHTASWGFVVASIGTGQGLFATQENEARDTQALLHWVEDQAQDPLSWLAGMTGSGPWGASGHSMGGGACMYLIGVEPRVQVITPLQPYRGGLLGGSSGGWQNLLGYQGALLIVAGELDTAVPWLTMAYPYHGRAEQARRNFFHLVYGMGHLGPTETPDPGDPLPAADQQRLHKRLVTGFFRAELHGEEDLYVELLGEGLEPEPVDVKSTTAEPPLWARISAASSGEIAAGAACAAGMTLQLGWSTATASISTAWGIVGIDPAAGALFANVKLGPTGVSEHLLPLQAGWSGAPLYLQGGCFQAGQGVLTRVVAVAVP